MKNLENKAGLYITIIFHLVVIIVLLAYQIDSSIKAESSFVLDFSKQEEIEKEKKLEVMKTEVSRRLDDLIAAARASNKEIRNIAVDAGSQLKDDRNTDADKLYKDAERLANDLKAGQRKVCKQNAESDRNQQQRLVSLLDSQEQENEGHADHDDLAHRDVCKTGVEKDTLNGIQELRDDRTAGSH